MYFGNIDKMPRYRNNRIKVENVNKSDVMNYDVLKEEEKPRHKRKFVEEKKETHHPEDIDDGTGTILNVKW